MASVSKKKKKRKKIIIHFSSHILCTCMLTYGHKLECYHTVSDKSSEFVLANIHHMYHCKRHRIREFHCRALCKNAGNFQVSFGRLKAVRGKNRKC